MLSITTKQRGFTLIELLVVIAILGILASIAIANFAEYKDRAFNSAALAELRVGVTAQEAVVVDEDAYVSCADPAACEAALPGFSYARDNDGSALMDTYEFTAADAASFTGSSQHKSGSAVWEYDSGTGVFTES